MERVIKYVILVSLSIFVSNAQRGGRNRCLKNLRVIGSTPTSITLGWDYKCATEADGDGGMRYKVYYEHLEWRACPSGHQDERRGGPGRGNYETTETVVVFEQLHPFSAYRDAFISQCSAHFRFTLKDRLTSSTTIIYDILLCHFAVT